MLPAGKLKNRVAIQRATTAQDEYGEEIETWADLTARWAAIFYGKGDERRQAAMEQGKQPASFVMRDDSVTRTVTIRDRLAHAGGLWDIVGISPVDGDIEFTAVRAL